MNKEILHIVEIFADLKKQVQKVKQDCKEQTQVRKNEICFDDTLPTYDDDLCYLLLKDCQLVKIEEKLEELKAAIVELL